MTASSGAGAVSTDHPAEWIDLLGDNPTATVGQILTFIAEDVDGGPIDITTVGTVPAGVTVNAQSGNTRTVTWNTASLTPGVPYVLELGLNEVVAVGDLTHDGPATPEQISLLLPITGTLSASATATVTCNGVPQHPMFRVTANDGWNAAARFATDAFATVITGLTPGTNYTVVVTITDGAVSSTRTEPFTTRSLPPAAGAVYATINVGTAESVIRSTLSGAPPGSVIQFADGTHTLTDLYLTNIVGTESQPIYIRGTSRAGTILSDTSGAVLQFRDNCHHIVVENLTLRGSQTDVATSFTSKGVEVATSANWLVTNLTVRNCTITGVDGAVYLQDDVSGMLVYDCTCEGNNLWADADPTWVSTNMTWNDKGITTRGTGNCVWNCTISGFGDAISAGGGGVGLNAGIHWYRNLIKWNGDDALDTDYGNRNYSVHDNRVFNSATFLSVDGFWQGPLFAFRNTCVNLFRSPFKLPGQTGTTGGNRGVLIYNNTVVRTRSTSADGTAERLWYHPSGTQKQISFRNNLLIWKGSAPTQYTFRWDGNAPDKIDFTNTGWYPDGATWYWSVGAGAAQTTLAALQAAIPATTPFLSGETKRHANDRIVEADPFATDVTLTAWTEKVPATYTLELDPASLAKAAGVAIPGITDGFTGAAPDLGAVIAGRAAVTVGDRT